MAGTGNSCKGAAEMDKERHIDGYRIKVLRLTLALGSNIIYFIGIVVL